MTDSNQKILTPPDNTGDSGNIDNSGDARPPMSRHRERPARPSVKQPDLATRLTAEPAPTVDEDGDVVAGIRFFLDGEPLYPETAEFLDSVEDVQSLRTKIDGYLRSRGIEDPLELYRLVAIWRQFYLASSYELSSC